jgi:L-alanine-DL-glutamate epimerase-like enolase superfamily enzyme
MRITGCRFYHVETTRETGAVSEHLLVRVDTTDGVSGWGELSDMHHIHPVEFPSIAVMEEEANLRIEGCDPFQMGATLERLGPVAYPAFDLALYDLVGKLLDTPASTLIGGRRRERIPFCYPIFTMQTPAGEDASSEIERQLQHVKRVVDLGQNRIRKYIGYNLDAEEQWLIALRDTFGTDVEIKSLDLSGRFHWQDALAILQRFRKYDYQVAESVSRRKPGRDLPDKLDLRGMAEVRRQLGIPISEHANSFHLIRRLHDANAVDVVNLATCANGIWKTRQLFDFAAELGLRTLHGTTQELSIGTSAAAQVMASLPSIDMPCDPAGPLLYTEDCTSNRVRYEDGFLIVPDGPGLGIDVDEARLERMASKGNRLAQIRARMPDAH